MVPISKTFVVRGAAVLFAVLLLGWTLRTLLAETIR